MPVTPRCCPRDNGRPLSESCAKQPASHGAAELHAHELATTVSTGTGTKGLPSLAEPGSEAAADSESERRVGGCHCPGGWSLRVSVHACAQVAAARSDRASATPPRAAPCHSGPGTARFRSPVPVTVRPAPAAFCRWHLRAGHDSGWSLHRSAGNSFKIVQSQGDGGASPIPVPKCGVHGDGDGTAVSAPCQCTITAPSRAGH